MWIVVKETEYSDRVIKRIVAKFDKHSDANRHSRKLNRHVSSRKQKCEILSILHYPKETKSAS